MLLRSLLFGFLLLFASHAYAGLIHDDRLTWQTAESAHFRIHFHDDEKALAEKSLGIAEAVYQRLTPILDWMPQDKTDIVLSDETDASNGFATPIPSNRMTLFVSSPNQVNSLEDHAGWLETLILHEFVHTLHLDKAQGSPRELRHIFGRMILAFPNVFMPPWMHEGLATYYETDKDLGIGRGQSAYFQMMMRMEVESGIKPLRQINQPMVSWPLLTSRYLYGVYFYQFLADTYGADVIPKLVQSYSGHWLPFAINTLYEDVLGKDLSQLWGEYQRYLERQFQPQLKTLKQQGIVQGKALTRTGDFKRSVVQAKDGRIFFVSDNLTDGSQLMMLADGQPHELTTLNWGANLDWHEASGLLISQPELCNNASAYHDLYRLDSVSRELKRLTRCQRYIAATWSPDGKHIMAIQNHRGQHALHLLDANGSLEQVLWQGELGETLSGLDWSADGQYVVSSLWREGTGWNLEEFDVHRQTWSKLTHNTQVQTQPRYVRQGRDIVFSAEEDAVYHVYRLSRKDNRITQLARVLGGAFSPFLTEHGSVLFIGYTSRGFDVYALDTPLEEAVKQQKDEGFEREQFSHQSIAITDIRPYSPWNSVWPTSWLPNIVLTDQGVELGAFVFGSDVLNRHSYSLYAGYQSVTSSPVFTLDYTYDEWFPLLKVYAQHLQTSSLNGQGALIALTDNQRWDAELIFPMLQQQERWSAHINVNQEYSELAWLHPDYVSTGLRYDDKQMGVALVYDARLVYPRGISNASTGRLWSVVLETGEGLGGDYTGMVTSIAGREYVDLGDEQVLALRLNLGFGDNQSRPFRLGGTDSTFVLPNILPSVARAPFNHRVYNLRGYGEFEAGLTGQDMALMSAEYRFPIARVERGLMAPPIGLDQVFGQVFADAGKAGADLSGQTYIGVGVELGADTILFYNLPMRMQVGYAKGLDDNIGDEQVYFRLGSSF